jgi:hypothetical protein
MPSPGDPSFDREARAARARQAVSRASEERLAELRSQHLPPETKRSAARSAGPAAAAPRPPAPRPVPRPKRGIDAAAIGRTARAALDKHPATWTSYAELCSATGLTRSLALTVARQLVLEPTGSHWFRIRDDDGVYDVPAVDVADADGTADAADAPDAEPSPFSRLEADRRLAEGGIAVVDGRADPERKLSWTGSGWALPHSD